MEEKICPQCKTSNPVAANFCRHCRFEFSEASKKGQSLSPVIKSFRIVEPSYTIGSTIHLEWEVENAREITLGGKDASVGSNAETVVEKPMRVALVAKNDYTEIKQELRIDPKPLPTIGFYRVSGDNVLYGQKARLEWIVRNALRTEVVASDGTIVGEGEDGTVEVSPTKTTQYQLKGYSKDDPEIFVEQTIEVRVMEPVKILDFRVDKESIIETEKAVLSWKVENASSVEISPSVGELKKQKKINVYPTHTTIYRLTARNELSMDEASVTIAVQQLPKFDVGEAVSLAGLKVPSPCDVYIHSIKPEYHRPLWIDLLQKPFLLMEKIFTFIDSYPNKVKQLIKK